MRNFHFLLLRFAGAAAFTTLSACHRSTPSPASTHAVVLVAPSVPTPPPPPMPVPLTRPSSNLGSPAATEVAETAPDEASVEELEPSPNELVKQARAALDAGDLNRALKEAKLAVLAAPGRSAAWNTLGRAQLRSGNHRAALDSFDQAVDANPSSSWARNNHGLALLYEGRYDEAVDELEEATNLQPDSGLMWNNLGMAYEHVDRVEEARSAYKRAMNLDHKGAAQNFVRIEGVRSLRHTAQADMPVDDLPMVDHGL